MIPSEDACSSTKAVTICAGTPNFRSVPEANGTEKTAWQRYQELVALIETQGGKLNRKSMLDSIFRGNDLVYMVAEPRTTHNRYVYENAERTGVRNCPRNCPEAGLRAGVDNKAVC